MKRRTLIGTGGLWFAPLAGIAQNARKLYRIGIIALRPTAELTGPTPRSPSATEARGAGDQPERFPELAAELVRLAPDVIVAAGPSLAALKRSTATIPVVMASSGDPVSEGLVQSLAHPGGNFTGMSSQSTDAVGKQLELLKEFVPGAAPVAVLWHRHHLRAWQAAQAAARQRGWKLLSLEIPDAGGIDAAFKAATDRHGWRADELRPEPRAVLDSRRVPLHTKTSCAATATVDAVAATG